MLTSSTVWRVAGIVSTDDILPAKYKHQTTIAAEMAPHVFEYFRPGLAASLGENETLVCDDIFGIGSSREQAVEALLAAGVRCVLASAFGRIFFRNAWNLGLVALELGEIPWQEGHSIDVDLVAGVVSGSGYTQRFAPVPAEMLRLVEDGGLLAHVRRTGGFHGR